MLRTVDSRHRGQWRLEPYTIRTLLLPLYGAGLRIGEANEQQIALGADTQYREEKFIEALRQREVAPHVSEYVKGNLEKNSLTEAERSDERRAISQRKRKLIERVFGWSKLDRLLRQVKLRGLHRVDWFYRLTIWKTAKGFLA